MSPAFLIGAPLANTIIVLVGLVVIQALTKARRL